VIESHDCDDIGVVVGLCPSNVVVGGSANNTRWTGPGTTCGLFGSTRGAMAFDSPISCDDKTLGSSCR